MTDPKLVKIVCESLNSGAPAKKSTLFVQAEYWLNDENGMWVVTVESGYFLTDMHREPELCLEFETEKEARDYAEKVSNEYRKHAIGFPWTTGKRAK